MLDDDGDEMYDKIIGIKKKGLLNDIIYYYSV
jgi:hypothetical protein